VGEGIDERELDEIDERIDGRGKIDERGNLDEGNIFQHHIDFYNNVFDPVCFN
jgi:hypothetical protein